MYMYNLCVLVVSSGHIKVQIFVIIHIDACCLWSLDTFTHTHIHLHIHICTHSHTHTYINTYTADDWRPGRTLVLCSWDAEEYGLIGSTEFVEDKGKLLREGTVAYLNVDSSVAG